MKIALVQQHATEMRVAAFQNGYYVALCNRVGREERLDFRRRIVRVRAGRQRDCQLFARWFAAPQ